MAKHAHTTFTVTRRAVALGAGAVSAIGIAAAMPQPHPDAELVALGAQLTVEWAKADAWDKAHHDVTDDELEAAMKPAADLVDLIEHMPAHTLDGLKVKALAISWCNVGGEIDPDRFCPYPCATTDARIAASVVRDLLRLHQGAAA